MPCDIGYKNFSVIAIPVPQPLVFKKRIAAPTVDAELLERIGQDDPEFLEWMDALSTDPLLELALKKALAAVGDVSPLTFKIENSSLVAEGTYLGAAAKKRAEEIADRVGRRFQAEVLAMVVELLEFEVEITSTSEGGVEVVTIEAERHCDAPVHEYVRVILDPRRGSSVLFEHFSSKERLAAVKSKFTALAARLGVTINILDTKASGSPIPAGTEHTHFLKGHGKKVKS